MLEFAIRYKLSYISHRLLRHVFKMKIVYLLHSDKDTISNKGVMWHICYYYYFSYASSRRWYKSVLPIVIINYNNHYADRCVVKEPFQFKKKCAINNKKCKIIYSEWQTLKY